jgi:hypothetical protein
MTWLLFSVLYLRFTFGLPMCAKVCVCSIASMRTTSEHFAHRIEKCYQSLWSTRIPHLVRARSFAAVGED